MADEEFRREIRVDPLTGRKIIVLPEFYGDLYQSQTSTEGDLIDTRIRGEALVDVRSPNIKLFFLEDNPKSVGDGLLYDRWSAFGIDERYSLNTFSLGGLELLIYTAKERIKDLQNRAHHHELLSQFYFYVAYDIASDKLFGRLLATRETSPTLKDELQRANMHFDWKERCLYCDMKNHEERSISERESRYISSNSSYITFVPFAPSTKIGITIIPFKHFPRFTDISEQQERDLARIVYQSLQVISEVAIKKGYDDIGKDYDIVNVAFHSAPVISHGNTTNRRINSQEKPSDLERIYHFHVEIIPSRVYPNTNEYDIPLSGWTVVAGRPKDIAYTLRRVFSKFVYLHN